MNFTRHTSLQYFASSICIVCLLCGCTQSKPSVNTAPSTDNLYTQNANASSFEITTTDSSVDVVQGTDTTIDSTPEGSNENPATVLDALQLAGDADPADAQYFEDTDSSYVGYVMVQYSQSGEIDSPIWDDGVKTERKIPFHFMQYITYNFKDDGTVVTIVIKQFDEEEQAVHYYSGGMMGTLIGSRYYEELPEYLVSDIQEEVEELVSMANRENLLSWTSFVLN